MGSIREKSIRDFDRLPDRIRLHRQADKSPVLVVEGPSDKRFLESLLGSGYAVFPAGNRDKALDASRVLFGWETTKLACVVDRDFDDAVDAACREGIPVFAYENADLEAMATQSDAFRRLLYELGSEEKINDLGGASALARLLHDVVIPLSRLREANARHGWGLAFDRVDLASKLDLRTLSFKVANYCSALSQTVSGRPSAAVLQAYASGLDGDAVLIACPRGSAPYYRGRDFLAAAGVGLRSKIGTCTKAGTEVSLLEGALRAAAVHDLRNTDWTRELERLVAKE